MGATALNPVCGNQSPGAARTCPWQASRQLTFFARRGAASGTANGDYLN